MGNKDNFFLDNLKNIGDKIFLEKDYIIDKVLCDFVKKMAIFSSLDEVDIFHKISVEIPYPKDNCLEQLNFIYDNKNIFFTLETLSCNADGFNITISHKILYTINKEINGIDFLYID